MITNDLYMQFQNYSKLLSVIEEQREELKEFIKSFLDQLDFKMLTTQSLHNLAEIICYEQLEEFLDNPQITRDNYLEILDVDCLEQHIIDEGIERGEVSYKALLDFWEENIIFKHEMDIPNCQKDIFIILKCLIELEQQEVELTPIMMKNGYYSSNF